MSKIAICWIGIGKYNLYFKDFYNSFNQKFCIENNRKFFIFTDNKNITNRLDNCITYEISNSCKHIGFILFRKFKYLLMAEDQFLDYDFIVFINGNGVCKEKIILEMIDPKDKQICTVWHACGNILNGNFLHESAAEINVEQWKYKQAGIFIARSKFFLKMANQIESWRMQDKVNGKSSVITSHDECYYNAFLIRNKEYELELPFRQFNYPMDLDRTIRLYKQAKIILRKKDLTNYLKSKNFKDDLY